MIMTAHLLLLGLASFMFSAQAVDESFFEAKIRPVLMTKCYGCHSSKLTSPRSGLTLDTKAGLLRGGVRGPAIVPGKPAESRLLKALSYDDSELQMPPSGKLADSVIADFERWIAAGAPELATSAPIASDQPSAALRGMPIEEGRKWWAFQPVKEHAAPKIVNVQWIKKPIDAFVLSRLEEKKLDPSPPADRRTLIQRAYIDLLGYKPTYEEVKAFENDPSRTAYEDLIERLLASPHYGERWARHWMDVVRYGEDNPTTEATNPPYPYAWRYRDWIIEALNADVPYDRFVTLQLAADKLPGLKREDLRALGYLGTAPVYHKDQKLSAEVIGTLLTDDWDDRIDALGRGILGLSIACARCHDHKFDPILTKDYYALQGVFASTMRVERPMFEIDSDTETRYLWVQRRLFDLHYAADNLTNEPTTVRDSQAKVAKWMAEIQSLKEEISKLEGRYPLLTKSLERYYTVERASFARRGPPYSTDPFMNAVYDAAQYIDGSDKDYTFINYIPRGARDVPILRGGSITNAGDVVPRGFPTVLSTGDVRFAQGSGRLELAQKIFSDAQALAARVIVNRVWGWHFGRGLVATPSDFGTQGEKPSHPELLDDLAARFIAHGWSLKWLHREIMLSATYRQSSRMRADGQAIDEENVLLWRMSPRRMDAEAYRDSLIRSAGMLKEDLYGPPEDSADSLNGRRTIYSRITRSRPTSIFLSQFDFPDPMLTNPARVQTTTPMQQLFVMNSPFFHQLAEALAAQVEMEPDISSKVRALYQKVLARDPASNELQRALEFLTSGTLQMWAQVLLETNEEILWP